MIIGVGIDIIEVSRIESSHTKFGDRFIHRILRASEIEYCLQHRSPGPFLAVRFSAKEAISKAFGTGIGKELGWQDMEILRQDSGQPYVVLHDKGKDLMKKVAGNRLHISLSHTAIYANAVAVLER